MDLSGLEVEALAALKELLVKEINDHFDEAVKLASDKLKDLIPGDQFDFLVDIMDTKLAPLLKEEVLVLVNKI